MSDLTPVAWGDAPNGYDSGKEALAFIFRAMLSASPLGGEKPGGEP